MQELRTWPGCTLYARMHESRERGKNTPSRDTVEDARFAKPDVFPDWESTLLTLYSVQSTLYSMYIHSTHALDSAFHSPTPAHYAESPLHSSRIVCIVCIVCIVSHLPILFPRGCRGRSAGGPVGQSERGQSHGPLASGGIFDIRVFSWTFFFCPFFLSSSHTLALFCLLPGTKLGL